MLLRIPTFGFLVLCSLLVNVAAESDTILTSSLLGRVSLWDCSSDDDCTAGNSTCVDGYCECESGYIYNTAMTDCLLIATALGDECSETLQCSTYLLSGAACESGVCTCGDGYHYTHGRCYLSSGLGESCSADVNCYVNADTEATSCVNGVCVCSDGFYQREYRTCRRGGYAEGDECTITLDCQFENAVCNSSYVCAYAESTTTTEITTITDSTVTTDSVTTTDSAVTAESVTITDSAVTTDSVTITDSVVTTENSSTTDNSTTSARVLGTDINEIYSEGWEKNRVVRSLARDDENATVGTECDSDANCTSLANSRCGPAGYCICNRAYYASSDLSYCIPELGEDCDEDDDISITNSLCRNGTWSCGYTTVASISQRICRKSTKNYNWSCLHDEQCYIFGPDSSCQSKRCLCDEGSHLVEDLYFCWVNKGIGETCQADEDCYVEGLDADLTCTNSVCTCPSGTTANSNNTLCKTENAALGEVCEDDDDCSAANSVCIDSICACPEYYYEVDEACRAGINATCSSDSDCIVANSTCSNDTICECTENFVADSNTCLAVMLYGEECESDIQCSTSLSNTYCTTVTTDGEVSNSTYCQCESDYHYRYGVCNLKTAIGGTCTALGDCYVESGIEYVVCRKGTCACTWDSTTSDTSVCSRTSDATTFFLSTWLGLILLSVKVLLA